MRKKRKQSPSKGAALGVHGSFPVISGQARISGTHAERYIDMTVRAKRRCFYCLFVFFFFFSEIQRKILSLEGGNYRKIWRFEKGRESVKQLSTVMEE